MSSPHPLPQAADRKLVDQFLRHDAPRFHEAFNKAVTTVTPQTVPQKPVFSIDFIDDVKTQKNLESYRIFTKYSDQGKSPTWDDVKKEAEDAMQRTQNRDKMGRTTRATNRVVIWIPTIQAWMKPLSENHYTATVCSALALFFEAAVKLSKTREEVMKMLGSLSETVDSAGDMLRIYEPDALLYQKAEKLFVAILEGTVAMVHWLDKGRLKEFAKVLWLQGGYGEQLQERMNLITSAAQTFGDRVNSLLHLRVQQVHQIVSHTDNQLGGQFDRLEERIERSAERILQAFEDRMRKHFLSSNFLPGNYDNMRDHQNIASYHQPFRIPVNKLLEVLQLDPNLTANDLAQSPAPEAAQSDDEYRALWILETPLFRDWTVSQTSGLFVANDLMRESRIDGSSGALTSLSTRFIGVLQSLRPMAIPLYYYCGLHSSPNDPLAGIHGLMKALNHQLLQHFAGELPFIDEPLYAGLAQNDGRSQFELFQRLLYKMSRVTVFCIIDDISAFDNDLWGPGLAPLVDFFSQLSRTLDDAAAATRYQTMPKLKVFFTVPAMGHTLAEVFQHVNQVSAPEGGLDMIMGMEDSYMQDSIGQLQAPDSTTHSWHSMQ
ncbi:hypothetical protein BS50DRAFT_583346 [Corynespora cassiicola Philippines]|uniref:Uncharacterized protein n=1 Tax=Corynespora cassiicola Philippines TaxID=1448308 RepID=A0A2T2P2F8_CORCC|nr:hypothetical protein BS50DRAFT_583346 [Corynespora cassiicola Philippines]